MNEIIADIKKNFPTNDHVQNSYANAGQEKSPHTQQSSLKPTSADSKGFSSFTSPASGSNMIGKVKMWINMMVEYDFSTNTAKVVKGPWTKLASDSHAKKKQPKAPKVAKEAEVTAVEEI